MNDKSSPLVQRSLSKKRNGRISVLFLSLLLIIFVAVGGTLAYLFTQTDPIENEFTPAKVSCVVDEDFDAESGLKNNVNVTNTGDIPAYLRVKLVTYRVNDAGQRIGGLATIPSFVLGAGWKHIGDYFYYGSPVEPGLQPSVALIGASGITLESAYADADGGRQVIEVMAEAIQADGLDTSGNTPTQLAWGVTIADGDVTPVSNP